MSASGPLTPTTRIFVSHSHKDNEFCLRLVKDLRRELGNDDTVWYDVSGGLEAGDAWWGKIRQELRARPIFIVVLSPAAMDSSWVNDEVDLAWKQRRGPEKKLLFPIIYQPCKVRDDLDTLKKISFTDETKYQLAFARLVRDIKTTYVKQYAAQNRPPSANRLNTLLHLPRLLLGIGSAIFLVAAIALLLAHSPKANQPNNIGNANRNKTNIAQAATATATALQGITQRNNQTATAASSATADAMQPYHEAIPGICSGTHTWTANYGTVKADSEAALKQQGINEAYICNADNVELVDNSTVAGAYLSASLTLDLAGNTKLAAPHYEVDIDVSGLQSNASINLDGPGASCSLNGNGAWNVNIYSINVGMGTPTPTYNPQPNGNIKLPSAFTLKERFDGTQIHFYVNSQQIYAGNVFQQQSYAITVGLGDSSNSPFTTAFLKNFVFTPLP